MMCQMAREWIPQLLDGELGSAERQELERHLRDCVNCAESFDRAAILREKIRGEAPYFAAPPELTDRVKRTLRASERRRPLIGEWWRPAAGIAATVLMAFFLWNWTATQRRDSLADEFVTAHVRSLQPGHLIDVPSSDRHTVKPWFNGRVDFSPRIEDLGAKGFPLKGGRLDYVHGRNVAAVVFERRQHVINLFISPAPWSGQAEAAIHGYNVIEWVDAGMSYWAVSDLNAAELTAFREAYLAGH